MNRSILFLMLLLPLVLAGCNYSVSVSGSSHSNPELYQMDVIDTYGNNSQFDPISSLAISPFVRDGEFEIIWDLYADGGYYLDFYINDKPNLSGSELIFTDYCEPGRACHNNPILYCEYQADFDVICENPDGDIQTSDIGRLVDTIPQTLYVILDVCDDGGFDCEYQALPVSFE